MAVFGERRNWAVILGFALAAQCVEGYRECFLNLDALPDGHKTRSGPRGRWRIHDHGLAPRRIALPQGTPDSLGE